MDAALAEAVRFRFGAPRRQVDRIESLILADRSDEEIGIEVAMSAAAVAAYAATFFAVREAGPSYVAHGVLRLHGLDSDGLRQPRVLAFLFGVPDSVQPAGAGPVSGDGRRLVERLAIAASLPVETERDRKLALRVLELDRRLAARRKTRRRRAA